MKFSLSGGLATMGSGVPYAFAAKYASPRRVAVAVVGDGAMQMMGINGLIDIAKYWPTWRDPRLIVLVLNNRDLNYVTWEQRVMEGDPRYARSQAVPDFQYAEYAKLLGLGGQRVERPDQVDAAWQAAFASDRPFVIDAVVDADVPTLPPTLTHKQLDMLDQALAHDPAAERVRRQMEEQAIGVGAS
jgi:pyruvate dehydrogenase (quinone)